jgi:hypothetical protein
MTNICLCPRLAIFCMDHCSLVTFFLGFCFIFPAKGASNENFALIAELNELGITACTAQGRQSLQSPCLPSARGKRDNANHRSIHNTARGHVREFWARGTADTRASPDCDARAMPDAMASRCTFLTRASSSSAA